MVCCAIPLWSAVLQNVLLVLPGSFGMRLYCLTSLYLNSFHPAFLKYAAELLGKLLNTDCRVHCISPSEPFQLFKSFGFRSTMFSSHFQDFGMSVASSAPDFATATILFSDDFAFLFAQGHGRFLRSFLHSTGIALARTLRALFQAFRAAFSHCSMLCDPFQERCLAELFLEFTLPNSSTGCFTEVSSNKKLLVARNF